MPLNTPSADYVIDRDPWITEKEAAAVLRVSVSTIRNERKRGRLGFAHVGKRVLIPLSALETYKALALVPPCPTTSSPDLNGRHVGTLRGPMDDVRDALRRARQIANKHNRS